MCQFKIGHINSQKFDLGILFDRTSEFHSHTRETINRQSTSVDRTTVTMNISNANPFPDLFALRQWKHFRNKLNIIFIEFRCFINLQITYEMDFRSETQ